MSRRDALERWWNGFWYRPASPLNLAAARVIIAVHGLWVMLSRDLSSTSALPDAFWAAVPVTDRWRFLMFPGMAPIDHVLEWVAIAALTAAALGVFPRIACLVSGLLLYHLAPLEAIFWTPNPYERGLTITTLALVVLAAGPSGDRLALWPRPAARGPASDYRWPLVLVQVFLLQVYFFAGWAKVYLAGPGWMSAENMRRWMLVFAEQDQIVTFKALGFWIASHPILCGAIGVSAVALDMGLLSVLFFPRLRTWLIGAALGFHAGIGLLMGIFFLNIPQLLIFVDWEALAARRTRSRDTVTKHT